MIPATAPLPARRPVWRFLLLLALVVSWAVAVPFMWKAVTTVPGAARLQEMQSKIMHVPSPATFVRVAAQSLAELVVLAIALWPWWRRLWMTRLLVAFLALGAWAVATMPLELTELEWIHHRWMVGVDVLLLVAFLATGAARTARAIARGPEGGLAG